jgi:DnaJ-domain-containing protein 1
MIDYFAVLDEPRRAWLDPEALKTKFLSLSGEVHPDRVHNASETDRRAAQDRYTQLNAAYQCLRDTKSRLRHLLELERGKLQDVQEIPPETMDLFFRVGQLCRETDRFLAEKREVTSPLLKVQLFERGGDYRAKMDDLAADLRQRIAAVEDELKAMDPSFARLESLYRLLSYYGRWRAQLQERTVQLALD